MFKKIKTYGENMIDSYVYFSDSIPGEYWSPHRQKVVEQQGEVVCVEAVSTRKRGVVPQEWLIPEQQFFKVQALKTILAEDLPSHQDYLHVWEDFMHGILPKTPMWGMWAVADVYLLREHLLVTAEVLEQVVASS